MTGPDDTDTPTGAADPSSSIDDQSTGAYALGALDPTDAAEFERRLARSEELRTEAAGFTDTAALLGAAVPPVTPPPHLKANLLAALDSTPQLPAVPGSNGAVEQPGETRDVVAPVTSIDPARRRARRGGPRTPARLTLFVAAAAAAAAIFVGGAFVGTRLGGAETVPALASQDLATLSTAPDMARTVIDLPDGGTAALMTSEEHGLSAIVLDNAQPLPDGEVYQAWLIRDGKPVSAGVMPSAGSAVQMLDGEFHDGDSVALTVEPAGGSETPTGAPIAFSA